MSSLRQDTPQSDRLFVALDLETTGLDPQEDRIIEVGAVRFQGREILDAEGAQAILRQLVNPNRALTPFITQLTGIESSQLARQPPWSAVKPAVRAFLERPVTHFIAHNVAFEKAFLAQHGVPLTDLALLDTYDMAFMLLPTARQANLAAICHQLSIPPGRSHRAFDDALATGRIFMALLARWEAAPAGILQALLAHSPRAGWGLRDLWAHIAAQRHLAPWPRNRALSAVHLRGHGAANRTRTPVASATAEPPAAGSQSLERALNRGKPQVLALHSGAVGSQALAAAAVRWAQRNDRRLLLCLPRFRDDPEHASMFRALEAVNAADRPSLAYVPDPRRCLDLNRLNAWKAGRILSPREIRFLGAVLHWAAAAEQDAERDTLRLRHTLETHVLWPRIAGSLPAMPARREAWKQLVPAPQRAQRDGNVTVMDHWTLFYALQRNPDFAADFDGIVVDDVGRLAHGLDSHFTDVCTTRHLRYALENLQALVEAEEGNDAAQWLRELAGAEAHLAGMSPVLAGVAAAAEGFETALTRLAHIVLDADERQAAWRVQEMVSWGAWTQVLTAWQPLAQALSELATQGAALTEALPSIDADEEPQPALYVQQTAGWLQLAAQFQTSLTAALGRTRRVYGEGQDASEIVHWVTLRRAPHKIRFHTTRLCGAEFMRERLLSQCDSLLFLWRGRGCPPRQGLLSRRLGLTQCLHGRVDGAPAPNRPVLTLVPADLPEPGQNRYAEAVHDLLCALAQGIVGCSVVLFTSQAQMRPAASRLRQQCAENRTVILEEGWDSLSRITATMRRAASATLCCTYRSLHTLALAEAPVQCLVLTRIPFGPPHSPIQDHLTQYVAGVRRPFDDWSLPQAGYALLRVFNLLENAPGRKGALICLDRRLHTKPYGSALQRLCPPGAQERTAASELAPRAQDWLAAS